MPKISKSLTAEQRNKYIKLLKEHVDVFAWYYEELRTYDTWIIQYKVPLKPNVKPFRQKLRRINPALFPVIEKELKKLLDKAYMYIFWILWAILDIDQTSSTQALKHCIISNFSKFKF